MQKLDLIHYGLKYNVYTPMEVVKTVTYKLLPNGLKKYPIYSIHRMAAFFDTERNCYDFNGIHIPKLEGDYLLGLGTIYIDLFHVWCKFNDDYRKIDYSEYDLMCEGPYPFVVDGEIMGIEEGDIVIDAGAWIGDFAAYAVTKGAKTVYAFEPEEKNFEYVQKTAKLNKPGIVPVKKGLSDKTGTLFLQGENETAKIAENHGQGGTSIQVTSIDEFVRENEIERIDYIKADIEGAERYMLEGAQETLKRFAPKLSLCTYHLPDDPQVMENLILKANPKYKVIQRNQKLFAYVEE